MVLAMPHVATFIAQRDRTQLSIRVLDRLLLALEEARTFFFITFERHISTIGRSFDSCTIL